MNKMEFINGSKTSLITNYGSTYMLNLFEDKSADDSEVLFISQRLEHTEFIIAVLYLLNRKFSQLPPNSGVDGITIDGELNPANFMDKASLLGKFDSRITRSNTSKLIGIPEHDNDNPINSTSITSTTLFDTMHKWKMIGYGACGKVYKFKFFDKIFAIKECDVSKSTKQALNELKNEHNILKKLKGNVTDILYI